MKVLFTTMNARFTHSSLALHYLSTYLEAYTDAEIIVKEYSINNNLDSIEAEIYQLDVDIICFSTYIWNVDEIKVVARNIRKVNPNVTIILGGPEVTFEPMRHLAEMSYVDMIITGEGERVIRDIVNQEAIEFISGLTYRKEGKIVQNPHQLIDNLDEIPFPYKDPKAFDNRMMYYESSRGCPYNCAYCLSSTIKGVRYFSLKRVLNDLQTFISWNVMQVKFVDRTFNADKKRSMEIWKFLIDNDNGYTNFHFEITASLIDDEVIALLSTARPGLFQFEIGVQSTCKETLESVNRFIPFHRITDVTTKIKENHNIHLHLDLIAGLPYETFDRFLESFDDVYKLRPDALQLGFLKLLYGSELRSKVDAYGFIYRDEAPYEVMATKWLPYDQMLVLKGVEHLVEDFYNSGLFVLTMEFLHQELSLKASALYMDLLDYFNEHRLFDLPHKYQTKCEILIDYGVSKGIDRVLMTDVVKFNVLVKKQKRSELLFGRLDDGQVKEWRHDFLHNNENIEKYLPSLIGQSIKKILKQVHFEAFSYTVENCTNSDISITKRPSVILFRNDMGYNERGILNIDIITL